MDGAGPERGDVLAPELRSRYPLADDLVARFDRDGHVEVPGLLPAELAERSRSAIAAEVARRNAETRPLEQRNTYDRAFLQITNLWRTDDAVAQFVLAPRFAGVAAELLGVDRVRLYHDQALFKEPGGGHTPWHQDASYWPLDGTSCITMWMPLVDLDPDMGGMVFASGTGRSGPLTEHRISDESDDAFAELFAESGQAISEPTAMRAGDASFHRGWTAHAALANRSDRMREVMTIIWYADGLEVLEPADAAQERDLRIWLPGCRPGEPAVSPINPLIDPPVG